MPKKVYIGDGVYMAPGSYFGEIILTTEDGITVQNTIVLGLSEISNILTTLRKWEIIPNAEE